MLLPQPVTPRSELVGDLLQKIADGGWLLEVSGLLP